MYTIHNTVPVWLYNNTGAAGERDGAVVEALKQGKHEERGLFAKGPKRRAVFVALSIDEQEALYTATNFYFG